MPKKKRVKLDQTDEEAKKRIKRGFELQKEDIKYIANLIKKGK